MSIKVSYISWNLQNNSSFPFNPFSLTEHFHLGEILFKNDKYEFKYRNNVWI